MKLENFLSQFDKTIKYKFTEKKNKVNGFSLKTPRFLINTAEKNLNKNKKHINNTILKIFIEKKQFLQNKLDILNSSSYEKWLRKGFAIVNNKEGRLVKDLKNLKINDEINIRLFKGVVNANIKKIKKL